MIACQFDALVPFYINNQVKLLEALTCTDKLMGIFEIKTRYKVTKDINLKGEVWLIRIC